MYIEMENYKEYLACILPEMGGPGRVISDGVGN